MLSAGSLADAGGAFARLKANIQAERAALQTRFRENADGPAVLREHCRLIDRTLQDVWRQLELPAPLALVAVGGYGRGELYPHSDIDVLILLKDAATPELAAKIEELVGRLWDMGLELGHSVRTVAECAEEAAKDVTVMTSLLEARLLAGSRELFARFVKARGECVDPQAFFKAKRFEQEQRHTKFQDSPYSLEPNLKEAPGGLRDLQVVLWISRACGLGHTWPQLARLGLITGVEARLVHRHHRLLQNLRARRRAADAGLLSRGEGDHPAEHHPAAEHRRRDLPGENLRCRGHRREILASRRAARRPPRRPVRARPGCDPRELPRHAAALRASGHDREDAARAVARARPRRRRV